MLGAFASRSLLLSASLYLLLWSALCSAVPGQSWRQRLTGIDYHEPSEAYIRNLPHYTGFPIMDVSDPPGIRKYARDRYGTIWLHDPSVTLQYKLINKDTTLDPDPSDVMRIRSHLGQLREQPRDAVRALVYGKPYKPTNADPQTWDKVREKATRFRIPWNRQAWFQSSDFLEVRSTLKKDRRVVLEDFAHNELQAFRLASNGAVQVDVQELMNHVHKRSIVSSGKAGSDGAFNIELTKRASDPPLLYNNRENRQVDLSFGGFRHFRHEVPTSPLTQDSQERAYSGMIHYDGVPVLQSPAYKSQLHGAMLDYGRVWIVPTDAGPFQMKQAGQMSATGADDLTRHLNNVAQDRSLYGDKIMLLKNGRSFPARASSSSLLSRGYKVPDWKKVVKGVDWPLASSDVYHMRQSLNTHNYIRVTDAGNSKTWGLRLLKDGKVEVEDITRYVRG